MSMESKPSRPRDAMSVAKKAAFATAICMAALVAVEVGLRLFVLPPTPHLSRPDAGTSGGYHALLQQTDRVYDGSSWVRAYRGQVYSQAKAKTWRVVCLGGSTTWGHHLERGQTWPAMLEAKLRDRGLDVEVINAARPWYATTHSVTNYAVQMRYFDPDVVIVMHGINDLVRSFSAPGEPPPEWDYGSYQGPMTNVLKGYRASHREKTFRRYNPVRLARDSAIYRLVSRANGAGEHATEVDLGLDAYVTLDSFRSHLAYLVELARGDGVDVVLATQPHVYNREDLSSLPSFDSTMRGVYMKTPGGSVVSAVSVRRAMHAVRDVVVDCAREHAVTLVDAERRVGGAIDNFMDDFHLTPGGNEAVADTMVDAVAGLLKRPVARRLSSTDESGTDITP